MDQMCVSPQKLSDEALILKALMAGSWAMAGEHS